ncbi:hypothetical protein EBR25_10990 [bacterium]|nr:hypothetical protein [bacterium]
MPTTVNVNYSEILKNFFKDLYSAEIAEKIDELLQKGYVLDDMVRFLSEGENEENDFVEHYEEYALNNFTADKI